MGEWGALATKRAVRMALAATVALWLLIAAFSANARAGDPSAALRQAEATVTSAEGEIAQAESELVPARGLYLASARRAIPADRAAADAQGEARRAKAALAAANHRAKERVAALESHHEQAVEDHDEKVRDGIAFGLAALVVAAIAFGWDRFCTSGLLAWLADQSRGQAIGLCVCGGIIGLALGVALVGADGVAGVLGSLLLLLALVLPIALLLGRHSIKVQSGRSRSVTGRERLPWVSRASASLAAALVLLGFASALFAEEPETLTIPPRLARAAAPGALASPALARAERRAAALRAQASRLDAARAAARAAVEGSHHDLRSAQRRLAKAEGDAVRYGRRLAAIEEREAQQVEEAEAEALEEEELAAEEESESAGCDPSYAGACLDPAASDYDCAGGSGDGPEYTGPVQVVGVDHYGLDADGDGYACEE